MEFNIYVKEKDQYKHMNVVPPANSDWQYFKSLRMLIEEQIEIIRQDMSSYFEDDEHINLKKPVVDNKEIQEKLNTLIRMRKENITARQEISALLSHEEFIICEKCSNKMYKTPIGVKYEKYGSRYLLKDVNLHETIKYVYMCEKCIFAISEDLYIQEQNNLKQRKELLDAGESFVPNRYGFWSWVNSNKHTKPSFMRDEELEPKKRTFEYVNIDGVKNPFVKIVEEFPLSNRKVNIK